MRYRRSQIGFRNGSGIIQSAHNIKIASPSSKSKRTSFAGNDAIIPALPTARRLVSNEVGQRR